MTVKATSNLSLDERSASFSIISDEVLGTKAVKEIFVTQESLAEGGPLEGLDAPVKWFFNGASGTDYTVPKEQFEQNNKLMASSGVGYISYFHTFNSDGSLHPNSTRMIGGTGQPYVTGAWKGDYWLFEVPVKNFKSGTKVRFTGLTRISGTGQKYWSLQYMDGTSWKPATDTQTATVNGEQITYTHLVPTANMQIDETMTFARGISDGASRSGSIAKPTPRAARNPTAVRSAGQAPPITGTTTVRSFRLSNNTVRSPYRRGRPEGLPLLLFRPGWQRRWRWYRPPKAGPAGPEAHAFPSKP